MPLPAYLELADGQVASLGRIRMRGNTKTETSVNLQGMKTAPKRARIHH